MEKLKLIGTWILWCLVSPLWKRSLKYRDYITVPMIDDVHEYFRNLLYGLGTLGESARDFDSQVNCRLRILLFWAALHNRDIKLDVTKNPKDLMWEINSLIQDNPYGLTVIRWNSECSFKFEYKTANSGWLTQRFPDGTVWGKHLSEENENLAYLVNILLNWKEV